MRKHLKRIAFALLALLAVLILGSVSACAIFSKPRPEGTQGAQAEALADKVLASVEAKKWEATGAVKWNFPRGHEHLWDRRRNLARVVWSGGSKRVLINLGDRQGVAYVDGERVTDKERSRELLDEAWAMWANDSFWLNPVVKIRDGGTTRALVSLDDEDAAGGANKGLLITYSSGGVTPGDAYLWIVDGETGRPQGWRMWVSILPIGGMKFEWKDWRTLDTGALVAADHDGLFDVTLTDIEGAPTLGELEPGADPFAEITQ